MIHVFAEEEKMILIRLFLSARRFKHGRLFNLKTL